MKCFVNFFIITLMGMLISCQPAHAYLDPGTGSMILQILVASFVAVGVFFNHIKDKIFSIFVKGKNSERENTNEKQ